MKPLAKSGGTLASDITTPMIEGIGGTTCVYALDPRGSVVGLQSWQESAG